MPSAEEENQNRSIGILITIVIDDPKQEQRGRTHGGLMCRLLLNIVQDCLLHLVDKRLVA